MRLRMPMAGSYRPAATCVLHRTLAPDNRTREQRKRRAAAKRRRDAETFSLSLEIRFSKIGIETL